MRLTSSLSSAVFSYPSAKGSNALIADFIFPEKSSAYSLYIKVCNILQEEQVLFISSYDIPAPSSAGNNLVFPDTSAPAGRTDPTYILSFFPLP